MFRVESKVEADFVKYITSWATLHNVELRTLKMNLKGRRGWPDRLVLWEGGNLLFIEFKQPGEECRALQEYIHEELRAMGFEVETHDNTADALASVKAKVGATAPPNKGDAAWSKGRGVPPVSKAGTGEDGSSS